MIPTVLDIADLPPDKLPPKVAVPPLTKPFDVVIRPPGSKSITNRALLLAALAEGTSTLRGALLDAEDSQVMIRALEQLGARIEIEQTPEDAAIGNATLRVTGVNGQWKPREQNPVLHLANAGTATRFLAAAAILSDPAKGPVTIDGNARMRERPIADLVEALRALGARVEYMGREGLPPLQIHPPAARDQLKSSITFQSPESSQFVSAIVLISPFLVKPVDVRLKGRIVSGPYLGMTEQLLAKVAWRGFHRPIAGFVGGFLNGSKQYPVVPVGCFDLNIEPDASGAAYFFAAAAITPGAAVTIPNLLDVESLQGDIGFVGALHSLAPGLDFHSLPDSVTVRGRGPLAGAEHDFDSIPDTAMTGASVACFAREPSKFVGLQTLRVKETDRIAALQTELAKIGVEVENFTSSRDGGHSDEGIRITPPPGGIDCSPTAPPVEFDTYNDHRMAMSLALIGLRRPNVIIRDPACVRKTYPTFWRDLAKLYK